MYSNLCEIILLVDEHSAIAHSRTFPAVSASIVVVVVVILPGQKLTTCVFSFRLLADHVREFSCGKLYYRTFLLDEKQDVLYVGAM